MTVRHFGRDADLLIGGDSVVCLHVAIEWISEVVRAVDEKNRHADGRYVHGWIPQLVPALALGGCHLVEVFEPRTVFLQVATAVDRYHGLEAVVDAGDDHREVAAPTDASDSGAVRVDFGEASDQRVSAKRRGDGVVCPLIG